MIFYVYAKKMKNFRLARVSILFDTYYSFTVKSKTLMTTEDFLKYRLDNFLLVLNYYT